MSAAISSLLHGRSTTRPSPAGVNPSPAVALPGGRADRPAGTATARGVCVVGYLVRCGWYDAGVQRFQSPSAPTAPTDGGRGTGSEASSRTVVASPPVTRWKLLLVDDDGEVTVAAWGLSGFQAGRLVERLSLGPTRSVIAVGRLVGDGFQ